MFVQVQNGCTSVMTEWRWAPRHTLTAILEAAVLDKLSNRGRCWHSAMSKCKHESFADLLSPDVVRGVTGLVLG